MRGIGHRRARIIIIPIQSIAPQLVVVVALVVIRLGAVDASLLFLI
jgi:hypothetical protein